MLLINMQYLLFPLKQEPHHVITAVCALNTHRHRVNSYDVFSPPALAFALNKEITSNYRFSTSLVQVQILETKRRKEHKWDFEGGRQREK